MVLSFNGVDSPNLTIEKKVELEKEPAMLCWFLFLESDENFYEFVNKHRSTIHDVTEDFLTVNVFWTASKSSTEMANLVSKELKIDLTDFPVAVFFDSFSNTTSLGYFRFKGDTPKAINDEMKFIVARVKEFWNGDTNSSPMTTETIVQKRRDCIDHIAPQINLKLVKDFAARNGWDITKIIQWLTRPFTGF